MPSSNGPSTPAGRANEACGEGAETTAAGARNVGREPDRAQPGHEIAGDDDVVGAVVQGLLGLALCLHRQAALGAAGQVPGGAVRGTCGELAVDQRGDGLLGQVTLGDAHAGSPGTAREAGMSPARPGARWAGACRSWPRPRWMGRGRVT